MSQKLMLVRFEVESGIPVDESAENMQSTYVPTEFVKWLKDEGWSSEIRIKESAGTPADIPITTIDDQRDDCLDSILRYVEVKLIRSVEVAHSHISEGLLVSLELDEDFSELGVWLNVREILKIKRTKYRNSSSVKLVVG